jgi:hypothetical protein
MNTLQMVPVVVPQNAGSPAKSLPLANFVFIPPPSHINPSHIVASGRDRIIGGYWSFHDPDGGISVLCVADGGVWGGNPPRSKHRGFY